MEIGGSAVGSTGRTSSDRRGCRRSRQPASVTSAAAATTTRSRVRGEHFIGRPQRSRRRADSHGGLPRTLRSGSTDSNCRGRTASRGRPLLAGALRRASRSRSRRTPPYRCRGSGIRGSGGIRPSRRVRRHRPEGADAAAPPLTVGGVGVRGASRTRVWPVVSPEVPAGLHSGRGAESAAGTERVLETTRTSSAGASASTRRVGESEIR